MRLRVKRVGKGLHPSEVFITVDTKDGPEEVVVAPESIENETIEVGYPVGQDRDKGLYLVQLPRPTMRGPSRVWVPVAEVLEKVPA